MWPVVRPAVFGEISSGKKYGGKTPVVRVPVARCPAVKWVDTDYVHSKPKLIVKLIEVLTEGVDPRCHGYSNPKTSGYVVVSQKLVSSKIAAMCFDFKRTFVLKFSDSNR